MRKLLVPVLVLTLLGVLAAAGSQALARPVRSVKIGDDFFVRQGRPATITVSKGTQVTFRWRGSSLHNVHARKGPVTFKSAFKRSGTFSKILSRRGTYTIFCDIHAPDMKLTIKVN
ncbi:MAG: plastocyanin/azurin family copper-binding protein [Geminicoccaceae bacterium]